MSVPEKELLKEAERWLEHAESDLRLARKTLSGDDEFFSQIAFHAQQAVEKLLKAILIINRHHFEKIHDLVRLSNACSEYHKLPSGFRSDLENLNKYVTAGRYPDIGPDVDANDAERAVEIAVNVFRSLREVVEQKGLRYRYSYEE